MEYLDAGDKAMSFWTRFSPPRPEDYDTDEEYQAAQDAYDDAEYWAIEEARERYYEDKYGG